jgi:hypothetical protein
LIWIGELTGFAELKFSGSPKAKGEVRERIIRIIKPIKNPKLSLITKYGCIVIL